MADLSNNFSKGQVVKVLEEIDREKDMTQVKSFYKDQTFIIQDVYYNEEQDVTYLVGGQFDAGINAERCVLTEKNDNPVPYCRYDLYCLEVGGMKIDLKLEAVLGDIKRNPDNALLAVDYMRRHKPIYLPSRNS